jgi:hypothetical protein
MFEFDRGKIPTVEFKKSWDLEDDTKFEIYQADGWDFELAEDERVDEIEHARRAIYAWIAWYEFLNWKVEDGREERV